MRSSLLCTRDNIFFPKQMSTSVSSLHQVWKDGSNISEAVDCMPASTALSLTLGRSGKAGNRQPHPPPVTRSPAPSHSAWLLSYNSVVLPTACSAPAHLLPTATWCRFVTHCPSSLADNPLSGLGLNHPSPHKCSSSLLTPRLPSTLI